jgi:hypothetical protein
VAMLQQTAFGWGDPVALLYIWCETSGEIAKPGGDPRRTQTLVHAGHINSRKHGNLSGTNWKLINRNWELKLGMLLAIAEFSKLQPN